MDRYREHDALLRTPAGLRGWREAQGLSRGALADLLGMSFQAVTKWESDARPVPAWLPLALAEVQRRMAERDWPSGGGT